MLISFEACQYGVRFTYGWYNDFFFPPLIKCSLRSRLCLCSAKFLYRMGSAYRLHRRTCYTQKEPPKRISEVLKEAATSSPTIFRSAVPSAMLSSLPCALAPLRSAVSPSARSAALRSLSRARAPHGAHRRPPRATPPPMRHTYPPQKKLAYSYRLHKRYGLSLIRSAHTRARVYYIRSIGLSNKVFGNPHGCIYVSDGKTNLT